MWFKEGDSKRERERARRQVTASMALENSIDFDFEQILSNFSQSLVIRSCSSRSSPPPLLFVQLCRVSTVANSNKIKQVLCKFHTPPTAPNATVSQNFNPKTNKMKSTNQNVNQKWTWYFPLSLLLSLICFAVFNLCVCQCVAMNVNFINEVPEWQVTHTHTHAHSCTVNKYHQ